MYFCIYIYNLFHHQTVIRDEQARYGNTRRVNDTVRRDGYPRRLQNLPTD